MTLRRFVVAAATGLFLVGTVWAGVGLSPVSVLDDAPESTSSVPSIGGQTAAVGEGVELGGDELLVGAAKVSLEPDPNADEGEVWVRDAEECIPQETGDPEKILTHAADPRITWIENNGCIYMGGFGIGPSQPVLEWDTENNDPVFNAETNDLNEHGYGLWARSTAFLRPDAEGKMRAVVVTLIDAEGYFGDYRNMCPPEKECGAFALSQQLGEELDLDPASFIFASTHAHSAMDFIGGWGGVPTWYMRQVAEAMRESVRRAVDNAQPATLETGDTIARRNNNQRRDSYWSAEDPSLNWARAIDRNGQTIATVGTFAAHATSFGGSATRAHADWPGVFAKRAEERFGGVGTVFEAGLGNMSSSGGWRMGYHLANLLPPVGQATLVRDPAVRVKQAFWDQPVTNGPLGALGSLGFFDRPFGGENGVPLPAVVDVGRQDVNRCRSASPIGVRVAVTAAKVGDFIITAAPGEIFSNYSNTIEERGGSTALAIGQANDALGYMPQSFESDHKARQGGGFVGAETFEYEDAYSIDGCFGDMALQTTIDLLGTL